MSADKDTARPLAAQAARARVLEVRQQVEDEIESLSETGSTVELDQPIGRLSRMDALQMQARARQQIARLQRRLNGLNNALRVLEHTPDDYGICADCEDRIGAQRLHVLPEARYCLECQQERDEHH